MDVVVCDGPTFVACSSISMLSSLMPDFWGPRIELDNDERIKYKKKKTNSETTTTTYNKKMSRISQSQFPPPRHHPAFLSTTQGVCYVHLFLLGECTAIAKGGEREKKVNVIQGEQSALAFIIV